MLPGQNGIVQREEFLTLMSWFATMALAASIYAEASLPVHQGLVYQRA
jgi:hypothetical protein